MDQNENKAATLMKYREILEVTCLKNRVTQNERVAIGKQRKDLGLTLEEAITIQIMVLGAPISDLIREDVDGSLAAPSAVIPAAPSNDSPINSDTSLGITGVVLFCFLIVGSIALFIAFPPSWPVLVLMGISKLAWDKFAKTSS